MKKIVETLCDTDSPIVPILVEYFSTGPLDLKRTDESQGPKEINSRS